jgi:Protein of unknown function (DUF4019)
MKRLIAFGLALMLPITAIAAAGASKEATDAARSWLALIDAGRYDRSWNDASSLFREHVTQAQWAAEAKAAREPLGAVESRGAPTVRLATSLPGAPDGQYAILQFHSRFAHKADAVEIVTMMMDDGTWKSAGYFIR